MCKSIVANKNYADKRSESEIESGLYRKLEVEQLGNGSSQKYPHIRKNFWNYMKVSKVDRNLELWKSR